MGRRSWSDVIFLMWHNTFLQMWKYSTCTLNMENFTYIYVLVNYSSEINNTHLMGDTSWFSRLPLSAVLESKANHPSADLTSWPWEERPSSPLHAGFSLFFFAYHLGSLILPMAGMLVMRWQITVLSLMESPPADILTHRAHTQHPPQGSPRPPANCKTTMPQNLYWWDSSGFHSLAISLESREELFLSVFTGRLADIFSSTWNFQWK